MRLHQIARGDVREQRYMSSTARQRNPQQQETPTLPSGEQGLVSEVRREALQGLVVPVSTDTVLYVFLVCTPQNERAVSCLRVGRGCVVSGACVPLDSETNAQRV